MQLKGVVLTKLDKNNDQIKKQFLINVNILYIHTIQYYFSSLIKYL